jgi:hypothetical protein
MGNATAASWNHLPAPSNREDLRFEACFTDDEAERLILGLVPAAMEDKWFVYFDDGWLRFHRREVSRPRSRTGHVRPTPPH